VTDVTLVNTHSTVENIDHHEDFACNSDGSVAGAERSSSVGQERQWQRQRTG
jgi:hypothetical protein